MKKQKGRNVIVTLIWSIKILCKFNIVYLILLVAEAIIKGVTPIATLLLTQRMINKIQLREGTFQEVTILLIALVTVEIINELFLSCIQFKLSNYELEFDAFMQVSILNKVSKLDCKAFENSNTYDLVNRTQYDADAGVLGNIRMFFSVISLFITTISYTIIIIKYNLFIFIIIILVPIVRYYFEKKYNLLEYDIVKKNTELNRKSSYISYLLTNAENFKEIKMFNLFKFFIDKFKNIKSFCNSDLIKIHKKRTIALNVLSILEMTIDFFVILNIITQTFIGKLLIGEFILYNNSINNLKQNLIMLFSYLSIMYKNSSVVEQIRFFFDLPPEKLMMKRE